VFVDEFYLAPEEGPPSWASVESGPAFWVWDDEWGYPQAVGFKTVIPNRYDGATQNPVTMRILLYFALDYEPRMTQCEYFNLAAVRLRDGQPVEQYGDEMWLVLDPRDNDDPMFLVVDVPINSPEGLGFPEDLEAGQMLAFGLAWRDIECPWMGADYRILGVEFFESETAALSGATVEEVDGQNCWCGQPPP